MLNRMMRDHEISLHKNIEAFNEVEYLDSPDGLELKKSRYVDARNRLMSFSKLKYVFYEIHKPIGGSKEKYLDVKVSTNGEIDMTGVIGLEDCEHVEWEYGSREYLRSLNTGNQRYDFRLSIPFNDANSIMWWKPDTPEQLEVDEEEEGKVDEPTGYRYYKPYETERFLRWFFTVLGLRCSMSPISTSFLLGKRSVISRATIPLMIRSSEISSFLQSNVSIVEPSLTMVILSAT